MLPSINITPTTLAFSAQQGATGLPPGQNVSISNGGTGSLTGLTAATVYVTGNNWLSVTAPSSLTAPTTVTVQPNTTNLPPGTYTADVNVAATGALNTPQRVAVTYTVTPTKTAITPGSAGRRPAVFRHRCSH